MYRTVYDKSTCSYFDLDIDHQAYGCLEGCHRSMLAVSSTLWLKASSILELAAVLQTRVCFCFDFFVFYTYLGIYKTTWNWASLEAHVVHSPDKKIKMAAFWQSAGYGRGRGGVLVEGRVRNGSMSFSTSVFWFLPVITGERKPAKKETGPYAVNEMRDLDAFSSSS